MVMPEADILAASDRAAIEDLLRAADDVADVAMTYLVRCLNHTRASAQVYARRHRIKSLAGIEAKVRIKRRKPASKDYHWRNITDIVGFRFITLYRDDIPAVSEVILRALAGLHIDSVAGCPFARSEITEVRLFMSNTLPANDHFASRVKDLVSRVHLPGDHWTFAGPELGERYSSIHFLTGLQNHGLRVPFEIQIRSVFEDAWGEVDHAALYEPRREGRPLEGIFALIERQSNALKKLMDSAADFADGLRSMSKVDQPPLPMVRPTIEGSNFVETVCKEIDAPADVIAALMSLLSEKESLDAEVAQNPLHPKRVNYIAIAEGIAALRAEQESPSGFLAGVNPPDERAELAYLMMMEESISRVLSFADDQLLRAIEILTQVSAEFPDHPVAWLRFGEANERFLESQLEWGPECEAVAATGEAAYRRAGETLAGLGALDGRRAMFAASPMQRAYVDDNLGRMHAFLVWRVESRRRGAAPANAATLAAVAEALAITHRAAQTVKSEGPRQRLLNSMCYYAAETIEIARKLGKPPPLACSEAELLDWVRKIDEPAPSEVAERALPVWDTLAFAYGMLGESAEARRCAWQVLDLCGRLMQDKTRAASTYRHEQEGAAHQRALGIVRGDGAKR